MSVNGRYVDFELCLDDEVLVSLKFSDDGKLDVVFQSGLAFGLDDLLQVLDGGRKLAELDRLETDKREADRL